jgi:hypothetical protein
MKFGLKETFMTRAAVCLDASLGLVHFKGLLRLRVFDLHQTRVTDAGPEPLASQKNLAHVTLNGTAVTDQGVAELKAALPKDNIIQRPASLWLS